MSEFAQPPTSDEELAKLRLATHRHRSRYTIAGLIARIDRAEVERDHFRDLWDGARVTEVSNVELIWVDHPLPGTGITSVRKVEANDA